MSGKERLKFYKEQIENNPELTQAMWEDCWFQFDDNINLETDILFCGEKSNYSMFPFASDSGGDMYVLLDDKYVGFLDSEGGCGIIASSVDEFFNFCAVCKEYPAYFMLGVFDSLDTFKSRLIELQQKSKSNNQKIFEKFIENNHFTTDISEIYQKTKLALTMEPRFILQANPEEYDAWDDVFFSYQKYINHLKNTR